MWPGSKLLGPQYTYQIQYWMWPTGNLMLSHSHLISYHVIIGVVQNRRYMSIQINTIHFWHHKYYCPESTDANPNECRKYCWSSRVLSIISYIDWLCSMRYLVRNDLHLLPRGGFRNVKKKVQLRKRIPLLNWSKQGQNMSESQANWESVGNMRLPHRHPAVPFCPAYQFYTLKILPNLRHPS